MSDLSDRLAALKNKLNAAQKPAPAPPPPTAPAAAPASPPPAAPAAPAKPTPTPAATAPTAPAKPPPPSPPAATSRVSSARQPAPEPVASHPALQEALTFMKPRVAAHADYAPCERILQRLQAEYAARRLRLMVVGTSSDMCQRIGQRLLQDPEVALMFDVREQPSEIVLRIKVENLPPRDVSLSDKPSVRIGRGEECEVRIDGRHMSRLHATLRPAEGLRNRFILRDEASTNGTFVNGARIHGEQQVQPGDTITLGADLLGSAAPEMIFHERSSIEELEARLDQLITENDIVGLVVDVTRPLLAVEDRVLKISQQQKGRGLLVLAVIPSGFSGNEAIVRDNIDEMRHRGGLMLRLDHFRHIVQVDERLAQAEPAAAPAVDAASGDSKISNLHLRLSEVVARRRDWGTSASEWLTKFAQAESPRLAEARLKIGWAEFLKLFEETHEAVKTKVTEDLRVLRDKAARDEAGRKLWQTAPALADQTQAAALRDIKKDLEQSKSRLLEPMLPNSVTALVMKELETFDIKLVGKERVFLHLVARNRPEADPDAIIFELIHSQVQHWGEVERVNIREKYGHGGVYGMLDELRQMLYQLPSVSGTDRFTRGFYDEGPLLNLMNQALQTRVQGTDWNIPFKREPAVGFVMAKTRMSLMTISSVLMIFGIFIGSQNIGIGRKYIQNKYMPWMFAVGLIVITVTVMNQIRFYKATQAERQEVEADKLRGRIEKHYLDVCDLMVSEVHKSLQNSLDWLERTLKSENVRLGDDITGVTKDGQAQGKLLDQQIMASEQVVDACDQETKWLATARTLL